MSALNPNPKTKMSIGDAAMADCILPTDIMLRILARLPVKSIKRFKLVSKLWCELFSSREFIKMYKGQFSIDPNNQSVIIFVGRAMSLINIDESPKKPSIIGLHLFDRQELCPCPGIVPVGCCNGLVCMKLIARDIVVLWNPALEMFQCVSLSEDGGRYRDGPFVSSLGLGYDAVRNDFKLVRIACLFEDSFFSLAKVYSVNSDSWTTIDVNLQFAVDKGSVVTVNGNPYWLAYTDDEADADDVEENVLVYFDVKLLTFKFVPLPPPYSSWSLSYMWLELTGCVDTGYVDWNGTLGYLECAPNKETMESYVKVWVFEDSWRCKHTLGPIKGTIVNSSSFVTCLRNENILWYQDGKCFLYDRLSNCVEEILTVGDHHHIKICGYTANFERTLKNSLNN